MTLWWPGWDAMRAVVVVRAEGGLGRVFRWVSGAVWGHCRIGGGGRGGSPGGKFLQPGIAVKESAFRSIRVELRQ